VYQAAIRQIALVSTTALNEMEHLCALRSQIEDARARDGATVEQLRPLSRAEVKSKARLRRLEEELDELTRARSRLRDEGAKADDPMPWMPAAGMD
jgi:predicted  nucleic acid-binding Zn-ribbon protein